MPRAVQREAGGLLDDPKTFFAPYATLLAGHFSELRAPHPGETPARYLDEHLTRIAHVCSWPASALLHERQDLEAESQENAYSDLSVEPKGERRQVLVVTDEGTEIVSVWDAMDTLNWWCPHLGGSLIAALKRASPTVYIWGPNEAVEVLCNWGDEEEYWTNVRHEAWLALNPEGKEADLPRRHGRPLYPLTRAQLRAHVRRENLLTPGRVRRKAGVATCRAAQQPLSDEQLRFVAEHPTTSDVQGAALKVFLAGLDEVRALEAALTPWHDHEMYTYFLDQDTYAHSPLVLDTDPGGRGRGRGVILESYDDYERLQMNAGTSEAPAFVGSLDVNTDLADVLILLGEVHRAVMDLVRQLADWPDGGVTSEMRAALRDLKPAGARMYPVLT